MLNHVQHDRDRHFLVTLNSIQGLKPPQKGKRVYSPEALKTIRAIEKQYDIDWNNDAQRQQLTSLNLSYNQITDLSPLAELTQLTKLTLWNNPITDLSPLASLTQLTYLLLLHNKITDLSPLAQLTQLTELILGGNQITDLSPLSQLTQLTTLHLWQNKIIDLSPLSQLIQLTTLDLGGNQITDLSPLAQLTQLTTLNLWVNRITHIPEWLLALNLEITLEKSKRNTEKIFISENPIQEPPLEIVAQGNEAMKAHFAALEKGSQELNELKVIFIGDGGAGKTSLIKRALDNTFDPNENMTHGIRIQDRTIRVNDTPIKAHFWDFGGQEMMHSTHQFFLSHRSLYVLVLDGRKEEDSEYWLNFIKTFGGNSPVMVVLNKIDDHPSFEVNRKFLLDKYPNIRGFHKTSCSTEVGIEPFFTALETAITQVEFIKKHMLLDCLKNNNATSSDMCNKISY